MLPVRGIKQSSLVSLEMLCLSIFEPTSSLYKSILFESLVYFLSLHPYFASEFQLGLLYIFQAYVLALRGVYFSLVKLNYTQAGRDTVTFDPISNSCWSNNCNRVRGNQQPFDQSFLFGMSSFSSIDLMKSRVY